MQKDLNLNNKFLFFLLIFCANLFSQKDTLFTLKKEKIACAITEISEEHVSFKINGTKEKKALSDLEKIVFKNGTSETIVQKKEIFDLSTEKTRNLVQSHASKWGTQLLKCLFSNVSLNTTYIDWDNTYKDYGNDSVINIVLKTFYALPGIEDKEQVYWKAKTTSSFKNITFSFVRASDNMTTDAAYLNCIHKLNRTYKPD